MAKKIVLGCAVALVLGAVGGGLLLYQFVYKPGREALRAGGDAIESWSRVEEIERLNDGVEDRSPFTPPDDGLLTADQVERFAGVLRRVREDLGPRWEVLESRYGAGSRPGEEPGLEEVVGLWRDLGGLLVDAKRSQVDAVNAAGFSLGEYRWVREQVYLALGLQVVTVGLDQAMELAREGAGERLEDLARHRRNLDEEAAARNLALVEPYRGELEEWAPLALLGL
jgi:hypothetical protein